MNSRRALPDRDRPARCIPIENGNRSIILSATACTKDRKPILANRHAYRSIVSAWRESKGWSVGRFVIMPDHIHFFCSPAQDCKFSIQDWTKFWKSTVSRTWWNPKDNPIWQQSIWDTQVRSGDWYDSKWAYIQLNPVRQGLVTHPDEWPFRGELTTLAWHDP
jgi:putative transposase